MSRTCLQYSCSIAARNAHHLGPKSLYLSRFYLTANRPSATQWRCRLRETCLSCKSTLSSRKRVAGAFHRKVRYLHHECVPPFTCPIHCQRLANAIGMWHCNRSWWRKRRSAQENSTTCYNHSPPKISAGWSPDVELHSSQRCLNVLQYSANPNLDASRPLISSSGGLLAFNPISGLIELYNCSRYGSND